MTIKSFKNHHPQVDDSAYIDEAAVVIGQVTIAADASVWPMAVVRGDVHHISIGAASNIQDGSVLHVTHRSKNNPTGGPLHIGTGVTVGHGVILHACDIGAYCLVGMGSTILDGARMEHHSMLAAGSLLSPGKIIPTGELWLGNPAKKARSLNTAEIESLEYSAQHYVKLKLQYQG